MHECYNSVLYWDARTYMYVDAHMDARVQEYVMEIMPPATLASESFLIPSTHRRRDSTVELICVGGVFTIHN